jgi:hypothetical protein
MDDFWPQSRTSSDFVVVVFVLMAAGILVALTIAAIVLAIFSDKDVGVFTTAIIDLTGTVIAALVGYMAGKQSVVRNGNGVPIPPVIIAPPPEEESAS